MSLSFSTLAQTTPPQIREIQPFTGQYSETWESAEYPVACGGHWLPNPVNIMKYGDSDYEASISDEVHVVGQGMAVYETVACQVEDFGTSGPPQRGGAKVSDGTKAMGIFGPMPQKVTITFKTPVSCFGAYWGNYTGMGWPDPSTVVVEFFAADGTRIGVGDFAYSHSSTGDGKLDWHGWEFQRPVTKLTYIGNNTGIDGLRAIEAPKISLTDGDGNVLPTNDAGTPLLSFCDQSVHVGESSFPKLILIANTGRSALQITEIKLADVNNEDFRFTVNGHTYGAYDPFLAFTIAPDAGPVPVAIKFSPEAEGRKSATLMISHNAQEPSPVSVSVKGGQSLLKFLPDTVGSEMIPLKWEYSAADSFDGFMLYVQYFQFGEGGRVWSWRINPDFRQFTVMNVPGERGPLADGSLYRLWMTVRDGNIETPSSEYCYAIPNEASIAGQRKPEHPVLFLHGHLGDRSTFKPTVEFITKTLGWKNGGVLKGPSGDLNDLVEPFAETAEGSVLDANGDFFVIEFGDRQADYPNANVNGLRHQGREIRAALDTILQARGSSESQDAPFILVAHSNGGLAARSFLTDDAIPVGYYGARIKITQLITYGTPHRGADVKFWVDVLVPTMNASVGPFLSMLVQGRLLAKQGALDPYFDCANQTVDPPTVYPESNFLDVLNARALPEGIAYTSIIGIWNGVTVPIIAPPLPIPIGWANAVYKNRSKDCRSQQWDGLCPADSQNMGELPHPPLNHQSFRRQVFFHAGEGGDFSGILYALDKRAMAIRLFSPIDAEVLAPDGKLISPNWAGIPAASYQEVEDDNGHPVSTIFIPFPLPGEYRIRAVPKPWALPTDTFTIKVTQNGVTTTVTENSAIQDIPAQGFVFTVAADAEKPLISGCPANIMVSNDLERCDAKVDWTEPIATDNVGVTSFVSNHKPGEMFPIGVTTIIYTASDAAGNTTSRSFTITVEDRERPEINGCPS